ncbi:MAG: hypothetical protein Kow0068_18450 [Marinilabiliales bacterium]
MTKVYTSPSIQFIYNLKNILENHGIESVVVGENRFMVMGELPPGECWIDLYVVDDKMILKAASIIRKSIDEQETENYENWTCANCNEIIEGQFSVCWKCGGSEKKEK